MNITDLPNEILQGEIFLRLDSPRDILACSAVCSRWKVLCFDDAFLWKVLCLEKGWRWLPWSTQYRIKHEKAVLAAEESEDVKSLGWRRLYYACRLVFSPLHSLAEDAWFWFRIEMKLHMDASRLYSSLRDVSSRCLWDTFCTESMSVRVLSSNLDIIRLQYGDSPHNCLKLLRLHLPFGSSELKFHHRYENSACLVTQSIHSSAGRPAADAACVPLDCKLEEVFRDPSLLEQCAERDALRAASLQAALQNENTATILGSGFCIIPAEGRDRCTLIYLIQVITDTLTGVDDLLLFARNRAGAVAKAHLFFNSFAFTGTNEALSFAQY